MTRRVVVPALTAALVIVEAVPAHAEGPGDDSVVVDRSQFGWVDTAVVDGGSLPVARKKSRSAPKAPIIRCAQTKSPSAGGYASQSQFDSGAPATGAGGWVIRQCSDGRLDTAWVPDVDPAQVAERVEQLARRATSRMPLPLPAPKFNPSWPSSAGPATLVAIPTWFWIDGWKPVSRRTQAGGVWAEVVATPVEATWDPGDGSPVLRCVGPGSAWTPGARESSCEHTYVRSSAGQAMNAYTARVSVTWRITWRGAGGRSGSLPLMERQTTFPIAVAERQTVVTMGRVR
ncbi:MAG: hypothetical protein ACT4QF_02495 [Sporichthyaceae bacterium]